MLSLAEQLGVEKLEQIFSDTGKIIRKVGDREMWRETVALAEKQLFQI